MAYQTERGGEQIRTQVKYSPYGQTCDLESIIIKFLPGRGVLAIAPHRLRDYKYSHFLRCFKIRRLLFDCPFRFSFTSEDCLWHDACSLDSMERNA